jgi:type I restriction enzyme, S subunit
MSFRYGTSVKCSYEHIGEPVLRIPNVDNGRINTSDLKFGALSQHEIDDLKLHAGDILMVRSNGSLDLVGRPALVEAHVFGFYYAGYLVRVRTNANHIAPAYVVLALITSHVRDQIEIPIRTTVGLKNVNATELSRLSFPLPPLAEQHRIVDKVDELMALCDQFEAQLTTTEADSRRLLEAVLHEALNPLAERTERP